MFAENVDTFERDLNESLCHVVELDVNCICITWVTCTSLSRIWVQKATWILVGVHCAWKVCDLASRVWLSSLDKESGDNDCTRVTFWPLPNG
jgi:hypothetical protein